MSPEKRSNIGRRPRGGGDGDERLCSDCWHASSYLLPNDIYTAERSMLVSWHGRQSHFKRRVRNAMHMFDNIQVSVSFSGPKSPTHHGFGEAAGSTLARTPDDYTPESDLHCVGVFLACEFNSFMVPEVYDSSEGVRIRVRRHFIGQFSTQPNFPETVVQNWDLIYPKQQLGG